MYFSWLVTIIFEMASEMPQPSQNTGKVKLGLKLNQINQYRLGFLVVTPDHLYSQAASADQSHLIMKANRKPENPKQTLIMK